MKRLLPALLIALLVHAAFFSWEVKRKGSDHFRKKDRRVLSIALFEMAAEKETPKILSTKVPKPEETKPRKKREISRKTPVKKEKKRMPPPMPEPEPVVEPLSPSQKEVEQEEELGQLENSADEAEKQEELTAALPEKVGPPEPAVRKAFPLYRNNPAPYYPPVARRRGYQGEVVLEVLVGRDGSVLECRVAGSSGYAVLDRAALESIRAWEFEAGRLGDEKIEMWVRVPVRYQLEIVD